METKGMRTLPLCNPYHTRGEKYRELSFTLMNPFLRSENLSRCLPQVCSVFHPNSGLEGNEKGGFPVDSIGLCVLHCIISDFSSEVPTASGRPKKDTTLGKLVWCNTLLQYYRQDKGINLVHPFCLQRDLPTRYNNTLVRKSRGATKSQVGLYQVPRQSKGEYYISSRGAKVDGGADGVGEWRLGAYLGARS